MGYSKQKTCMYCFAILCGLVTLSLCSYWCYQFSRNEDLTVVQYKEFQGTKEDIFPTASFCLGDNLVLLKEKLDQYDVNETSYLSFLKGNLFDNKMLNINFSYVTIDITDYIKGYRLYFKNGSSISFHSGLTLKQKEMLTFTSFVGVSAIDGAFFKCFALQIPKVNDLFSFRILMANEIFGNGIRPTYQYFKTFVHSSKQFLLSLSTAKWVWPYRSTVDKYKIRIRIQGVDVVLKRDKRQQPCNQYWLEYDDWVLKLHKKETGCTNPYQEKDKNMPVCNTQEQMARTMFGTHVVKRKKYTKPCKTVENVRIEYVESKRSKTATGNNFGEFWFDIGFPMETFKEITQVR